MSLPSSDANAPPPPALELAEFLPYRTARLAAQLSRGLAACYQAEFDISIVEWRILIHLASAPHISVRDIAIRVDLDRVQVTRAVQRLTVRQLVTKIANPEDRRLVRLALTDSGRELADKIAVLALAYEATAFAGLSAAQRQTLFDLLDQVEGNLAGTPYSNRKNHP